MRRWCKRTCAAVLVAAGAGVAACNADKLFNPTPEARGQPPLEPAELGQFGADGVAPIGPGDTIGATTIQLRATVADPDSTDSLHLEIELRSVDAQFRGTPTHTSDPLPVGSRPVVTVSGLSDSTAYHWQARTVDRTGLRSAWVAFGSNAESDPDFGVMTARAPAPPTAIAQFADDGATTIGVGEASRAGAVVLAATVFDPDPNSRVRFQVEVQPVGSAFTGAATSVSETVASGARASIRVAGLSDDTPYQWQCRAVDELGATSPWVGFGNNGNGTDFLVAIPDPPGLASTGQYADGGTTAIGVGEAIGDGVVVLAATPSDPDPGGRVRLQVEVRPVGTTFTGAPTGESTPMVSGERAMVRLAGLADDAPYHWQARALDETGRTSPWGPFGNNAENAPDFRIAIAEPPAAASAGQYAGDGTTAISVGGASPEGTVVLAATVSDPDFGANVRLQVEVRQSGSTFTGSPTGESAPVAGGGRASVRVTGLNDDATYRWQYRPLDETGRAGPWAHFGGNNQSAADFRVAIPEAPSAPASLGQFRGDGTTAVPVGGGSGGLTVVLRGTVSDPDPGDVLKLELEVRTTGTAFSSVATHSATGLGSGDRASIAVVVLPLFGYHWQTRTCDAGRCSVWMSFGANPEQQADFVGTLAAASASR